MTLEWSGFTNEELLCNMPDSFQYVLKKVWQQHYEELYEPETERTTSLSYAINEILGLFQDSNPTVTHLRYVWMALILALVVEPTIKYYQPSSSIPEKTIKKMDWWFSETLANMFESKKQSTRVINQDEIDRIIKEIKSGNNFDNSKLTSFQIWQEALDVYLNAIKTLDFNQSSEALIEILDDCLEGYAIFPGSKGRRELFDWWLLEVVPASWYLLPPSSIYAIDNLANRQSIVLGQMKILKCISSAIWEQPFDCSSCVACTVGWNEAFAKMSETII